MSNRNGPGERKRYQILGALIERGGKAKTSKILEEMRRADISGDLLRYHCDVLENKRDPPLVELVGKEQAEQKHLMPENVYRITDHGRESYDEAGDDKLSLEEAESFVELRAEVVELRQQVDESGGGIEQDEIKSRLDDIESAQNILGERLLNLEEKCLSESEREEVRRKYDTR